MFSERLEKLIQSSLQDGILTDQEKAAIIKRAKAEGEDIDEVEIYIDSLLQKRQKELNNSEDTIMANNLIPEELNTLIQEYLTDGVLTDKERSVILNKAEKMGLDRDEIDLYLDAQVQKIDQQTDAAARRQRGKTCPYCGGSIPQLTDKCPHCGENVTPEASSELQEIFDNLEEALVDFKSGKDLAKSKATVERFMRKAKMYYGNNPKIQKLLEEVEMESAKAEKVAKANARKNTFVKILTYNWKITAVVVAVLLASIIWGVNRLNRLINGPDLTSDATACTKAIREALNNNDIETAVTLWKGFDSPRDLGYEEDDIARACIKHGDIDKALGITGKRDPANAFDDDKPIFAEIENAYLEKGEYDKAIGVWDRSGWCAKDNYRILCTCIDKMRSEKSPTELKYFIDRYLSLFYDEDRNDYKSRLYEYAGIK